MLDTNVYWGHIAEWILWKDILNMLESPLHCMLNLQPIGGFAAGLDAFGRIARKYLAENHAFAGLPPAELDEAVSPFLREMDEPQPVYSDRFKNLIHANPAWRDIVDFTTVSQQTMIDIAVEYQT